MSVGCRVFSVRFVIFQHQKPYDLCYTEEFSNVMRPSWSFLYRLRLEVLTVT